MTATTATYIYMHIIGFDEGEAEGRVEGCSYIRILPIYIEEIRLLYDIGFCLNMYITGCYAEQIALYTKH